jgi:hypothetical protein
MSISFSCGQCGKDYVVSDNLAGKSAICKACGARMTVPGVEEAAAPADAYGLDEAESSFSPASAAAAPSPDAPEAPPRRPVFGATKPKPPVSGGRGSRAIGILIGIIVAVVLGLRGGLSMTSKSEIQAYNQRQLDLVQQVVTSLQAVKDVESAKAASGSIKESFDQLADHVQKNAKKKGRKKDIEAVNAEFQPRIEAAGQQMMQELLRISLIPGASEALDLQGSLDKLGKLEGELGKEPNAK